MRITLLLTGILLAAALDACTSFENEAYQYDATAIPPVYCYATLAHETCYSSPPPGEAHRLINYVGPPPAEPGFIVR